MFFIAGLILLLAGSSWFQGAHTVGLILFIIGLIEVFVWGATLTGFFVSMKR